MVPSVRSSFSEPLPVMHFPSESEMPMTPWKTYDSFENENEVDLVDGEPFVAKISTLDYFETVSTFQAEPVALLKEPLNTNLSSPPLHPDHPDSEPSESFVCKLSTFELFEETPTVAPSPQLFPAFPAFIDSEMRELNICHVSTYDSFCGVESTPVVSEVQKLSTFDFFEHGTPAPLAPLAPAPCAPCAPCVPCAVPAVPAVPVPMTWPSPSTFLQPPCFQDDTSNNSCLSTSPRTPMAPITPSISGTSGASAGTLSGPLQVTGASGKEVVCWTVGGGCSKVGVTRQTNSLTAVRLVRHRYNHTLPADDFGQGNQRQRMPWILEGSDGITICNTKRSEKLWINFAEEMFTKKSWGLLSQ